MKKINLIYWISTGLFALFMAFTALPDIMMVKEAVEFMHHLGYPDYFTIFLGSAKLLGSIAILIPNFRMVKEWAYAGLFFDLIGATYSNIIVDGFQMSTLIMMPILFAIGSTSYLYNHKKKIKNEKL